MSTSSAWSSARSRNRKGRDAARRPGDATAQLRKEVCELIDSHDALLESSTTSPAASPTDLLAPNGGAHDEQGARITYLLNDK